MKLELTPEQQSVVDAKTSNILVAAAAGSGKTAVLVERILRKITDKNNPVDIDEILIVTFTNDAAAQMRDRLRRTIDERLKEHPEDENLIRQSSRLNYAHIMTLDSFCIEVVKRNFHALNVDPSFSVLEESDRKILWQQAMENTIEEYHEKGDALFYRMMDMYASTNGDGALQSTISDLRLFSDSTPFPDEWIQEASEQLRAIHSLEDMDNSVFATAAYHLLWPRFVSAMEELEYLAEICTRPLGPIFYRDVILEDLAFCREMVSCKSFHEMRLRYETFEARAIGRAKGEFDADMKDYVHGHRSAIVKFVKDEASVYFPSSVEETLRDIENCAPAIAELCELTIDCRKHYHALMEENNAYDFSEIEHMTLDLFIKKNGDEIEYTDIARQYRESFKEIMVDEYQDSNLVQEYFLCAISGQAIQKPNMFMVGDIKQSIYRFRMARPEIFMDKFNTFETDRESENRLILLNRNFRSRAIILNGVNRVFRKIMKSELGGVQYDEKAFLRYRNDEQQGAEEPYRNEFLLLKGEELESKIDDEVRAVCKRITELTDPVNGLLIKDDNGSHIARYGDIAILARKRTKSYYPIIKALNEIGIPAYADENSGYFTAEEVTNVLSYLTILDNPLQDVAFTTVLLSPFVGMTYEELALLRIYAIETEKSSRTDYSFVILKKMTDAEFLQARYVGIRDKAVTFFRVYDEMKEKSTYLSVPELISEFYRVTDYLSYVSVLPGGDVRERNLLMLVEKAKSFMNGLNTELYDFVRYIEDMKKYEINLSGECADAGNAVRVLTIHKSKGLEFPIVFVVDLFVELSQRQKGKKPQLYFDGDLKIGAISRYPETKTEVDTWPQRIIINKTKIDELGEILRLYYVALTRAKEKLIVVGYETAKEFKGLIAARQKEGEILSYEKIRNGHTFQKILLEALFMDASEEALNRVTPITVDTWTSVPSLSVGEWDLFFVGKELMDWTPSRRQEEEKMYSDSETTKQLLREFFNYQYPYRHEEIPVKVSVSALKKSAYEETEPVKEHPSIPLEIAHVSEEPLPAFRKGAEIASDNEGALTGSLYHRLLELHDYKRDGSTEDCIREAEELVKNGYMEKEVLSKVSFPKIAAFYCSDIGLRMKAASENGNLQREKAFVMSVEANLVSSEYSDDETILVQGIIDAFFLEDDEYVLLDYKTDRIPAGEDASFLVRRYGLQLKYYADAIRRATGKNVKEACIYSFALQKCIKM